MAIQYFDMGRSMGNALATAGVYNQMQDRKQMRNFLAENGEALMSGDPAALGQYAQYDPGGALSMRNSMSAERRAQAAAGRQQQEFDLRMAEYARNKTAAELAQERDAISTALRVASAATTPEEWDAGVMGLVQRGSIDEEVAQGLLGQFDKKDALIAEFTPMKDWLDQRAPKEPADEYGRYAAEERAAGREPLSRIDFKRAGQKSMRVVSDGAGGVTVEETFGAAAGPKATEGGLAAAGYLSRMRAAEEVLDELSKDGPATLSLWSRMASGTDFEGYALSPQQQRVLQASRDWVRAKLRKESGAVIGPEEMAEEIRTYFPMPGEDKATVEQKRQARKEAERQFEIMSGPAAALADPTDPAVSEGSPEPGGQIDLPPDLEALFEQYPAPAGR